MVRGVQICASKMCSVLVRARLRHMWSVARTSISSNSFRARSINGRSDGSAEAVAIVRAMTQMGLSLGMSTTAEDVETAEQRDIVRAEGCTEV
jgi:predicted signal transduction protein with EAL and GGDEF domain